MTAEMELVVGTDGVARCIYGEELNLRGIGQLKITRASHVEPDAEGYWWADMGPVDGPVLGPFRSRSEALGAEREWLGGATVTKHNLKAAREPVLLSAGPPPPIAIQPRANHRQRVTRRPSRRRFPSAQVA
jgi:hypothetical protein